MLIGYSRISTDTQSLDPQNDQLNNAGCERIFSDIASGAKSDRQGLQDAINYARQGDTIVVVKLDRFGRSLKDLITRVIELGEKGIEFRSLSEAIDTGTSAGKLMFHVMGALAEFERDLIRDRTRAGLEAARARGRKGGRPPKHKESLDAALTLYDAKKMTLSEIQKATGVSKTTLYRNLNKGTP